MTTTPRPSLLSDDPAVPYNAAIDGDKPGQPPSYPGRNLVNAWRALTIIPWLQETSLEQVVELWQWAKAQKGKK